MAASKLPQLTFRITNDTGLHPGKDVPILVIPGSELLGGIKLA